jgi:hypothetical protein
MKLTVGRSMMKRKKNNGNKVTVEAVRTKDVMIL